MHLYFSLWHKPTWPGPLLVECRPTAKCCLRASICQTTRESFLLPSPICSHHELLFNILFRKPYLAFGYCYLYVHSSVIITWNIPALSVKGANIYLCLRKDGSGWFVLDQPSSDLPFPVDRASRARQEAALAAHVHSLAIWREMKEKWQAVWGLIYNIILRDPMSQTAAAKLTPKTHRRWMRRLTNALLGTVSSAAGKTFTYSFWSFFHERFVVLQRAEGISTTRGLWWWAP